MRNTILIILALAATTSLSSESLWHSKRNSETSMFADRLATRIGDILSVVVDESTIVSRNSSKNTSSSSSLKSGIVSFLYPAADTTTSVGSGFGKHKGALPDINIAPKTASNGEGSYSDTNIVEARIAVVVIEVLPNGNLGIEGARKIKSNGETQYMVMRGIVRRDDVMTNNSIMSYNILNANVELLSEGDLSTAQRKNFINQAFDAINIL